MIVDPARHRRLDRRRRRSAPGHGAQSAARAPARSTSRATPRSCSPPPADDLAHPAFGKLFLETEYLPDSAALLCHRRPRDPREPAVWAVHVAEPRRPAAGPGRVGDRPRALPRPRPRHRRPRGARRPRAVGHDRRRARSDRQPAPADPAGAGRVRAAVLRDRHRRRIARRPKRSRRSTTTRAPRRAPSRWPSRTPRARCATSASPPTRRCSSSGWPRACSFADGSLRASPATIASNELGQAGLWPHGISGDLPILLVRVVGDDDVAAGAAGPAGAGVLALKGLSADVVILNEHPVSYLDEMHAQLTALLDNGPWATWKHRPGGAYLLRARPHGRGRARRCSRPSRAPCSAATAATSRAQLDRPHPVRRAGRCAARRPAVAERLADHGAVRRRRRARRR